MAGADIAGAVRGVVFDVDGTLVDTNYLHTVAWWSAFRQQGHTVPMARIHRAVGMGSHRLIAHLLGDERDQGGDDELADAHTALYATFWERLRPLPGAVDLLRECVKRGQAVALASSASPPELAALRRTLDVDGVLAGVTGAGDVESSKPAPDIFAAAVDKAGLRPGETVVVGDSVWDVKAAADLGAPCIGLLCGGTSAAELVEAGAVATYDDPAALLAAYDDSPLARR